LEPVPEVSVFSQRGGGGSGGGGKYQMPSMPSMPSDLLMPSTPLPKQQQHQQQLQRPPVHRQQQQPAGLCMPQILNDDLQLSESESD